MVRHIARPEAVDCVAVGVCALGVRSVCCCSWCEGCRGSLVMVWRLLCALGVVLGVFAHGVELLRSGRWCGVSARSLEVAQIVSFAPGLSRCKIHYIYKVLVYFQTKIALN